MFRLEHFRGILKSFSLLDNNNYEKYMRSVTLHCIYVARFEVLEKSGKLLTCQTSNRHVKKTSLLVTFEKN